MVEEPLVQLLLLLGAAVAVVTLFHRLQAPPVLGYLLVGVPAAAAFVVGAVFAQSSSTIIGRQLQE